MIDLRLYLNNGMNLNKDYIVKDYIELVPWKYLN